MVQTFTGKNSYALQEALSKLVAAYVQEAGELSIERYDASETEADIIIQAVQGLPFLVPKKLVVVHSLQTNNSLLERIEELVDRTADGVDVVLVEPQLDKRKASFKSLQRFTKLTDFKEPQVRDLPDWALGYAKQHGATISLKDAQYLVERVGAHQQQLARELEKLALYSPKITRETIDLLTDRALQATIFELLDAAFSGNTEQAIRLYREQRQARVEPMYVMAMLAWQLHALALAVYAPDKTETALVEAGLSPFTARKALQMTRRVSKADIKRSIVELSELDVQIKTSADPDAGIELYLLELTSRTT